jgi:predicted lysophospholipase L1 biosynthesis ABC-type transport system permease subunit
MQIIGMVEDTLEEPLTDPAPFSVYFPFFAYPNRAVNSGNVSLALALNVPEEPEQVMSRLPRAVAEILPTAPVTEIKTFRSLVRDTLGRRLALSQVLSALAVVALILAAIGLAGVASYSVARRFQELAIRRMLGATERGIRLMVLREMGSLVAAGILLGMLGAWFSRHLMAAFLQDIAPTDPVTYLGVLVGALAITVGAALVATRPIAKLSPAQVLARH